MVKCDLHSLLTRMLEKVEVVPCRYDPDLGPCWQWTACTAGAGYPAIKVAGKCQYAHRVAYTVFRGAIPEDEQVHHRCLNNLCVNPAHLEAVTPEINRRLQSLGIGEVETVTDDIPF